MADLRLFAGILTAFVLASAGMALIIDGKMHTGVDKFNYGLESNEIYFTQNFTSNSSYSQQNVFGATDYSGKWTQSEIGYTLTENTLFLKYPSLLFKNILKLNGKWDNTYYINNSVHNDYIMYLRRTNNFLSLGDNIEVKVDSSGIHVKEFDILSPYGYDAGVYLDSSIINTDSVEIRTVYDDILNTADVYFQGVLIIQTTNLKKLTWMSTGTFYYAGVASRTVGFTLSAINTKMSKLSISSVNTGMDNIISFLTTFIYLLGWNVDEVYLPWVFNIILIKIPEATLFLWFLALIRGA
jgi:hypothetical protein